MDINYHEGEMPIYYVDDTYPGSVLSEYGESFDRAKTTKSPENHFKKTGSWVLILQRIRSSKAIKRSTNFSIVAMDTYPRSTIQTHGQEPG